MQKPLVDNNYLLQKFPGKGGWTYAAIPEVLQDKKAPFGWVKVKGYIDDFEIKNYKLMPMVKGKLFLPVKADIRKKIEKNEGDWIKVVLFADHSATEIPEELLLCLMDEPTAYKNFLTFSDGEQKSYIDWIYAARKDETKVARVTKAMSKIIKGEKFYKDNKNS